MRRIATALVLTLTLAACGGDAIDESSITPAESSSPSPEPGPSPTGLLEDEFEGEERDPDALFGSDVCIALLPALEGKMTGLERYATVEVLDALEGQVNEGAAEFANVSEDGDTCTIEIGDAWAVLTLMGDGHVGHGATDITWFDTYGNSGLADPAAIEADVEAYRASGDACDGEAEETNGPSDHEIFEFDGGVVVAVLCDFFAYQGIYELMHWDPVDRLAPATVEQWRGNALIQDPLILGFPYVEDGLLRNLERARGVGGCGAFQQWFRDGRTLILDVARERSCEEADSGNVELPPEEWPVVYALGG